MSGEVSLVLHVLTCFAPFVTISTHCHSQLRAIQHTGALAHNVRGHLWLSRWSARGAEILQNLPNGLPQCQQCPGRRPSLCESKETYTQTSTSLLCKALAQVLSTQGNFSGPLTPRLSINSLRLIPPALDTPANRTLPSTLSNLHLWV